MQARQRMSTTFVLSLLRAMVGANGERLVLRAGEIPCILTPRGRLRVATAALPPHVVASVLQQLLPPDLLLALDELGTIEYDLPPMEELPAERFTVIAEDHVIVELKRHCPEEALALPAAGLLWPERGAA